MCKVDFDSIKYPGLHTGKSPLIKGARGLFVMDNLLHIKNGREK